MNTTQKQYNDLFNEGEEGYIPNFFDKPKNKPVKITDRQGREIIWCEIRDGWIFKNNDEIIK